MKTIVLKTFRDKTTGILCNLGSEIEVTKERFGELTAGPRGVFVKEVKEPIAEPVKESVKKTVKK